MNLLELRIQIDKTDEKLLELFLERMSISAKIAKYKKENGIPVHDPARESEKLSRLGKKAGEELSIYAKKFFSFVFELSRSYQSACIS